MVLVSASDHAPLAPALGDLARDYGVTTEYVDGRQQRRRATPEMVLAVVNAIDGGGVRTLTDARTRLRERRQQRVARVVDAVTVVDEGVESVVAISVARKATSVDCRLEFEFGAELSWSVAVETLRPFEDRSVRGADGPKLALPLPVMRVGYHRLHLNVGRVGAVSTLIVRPLRGARGRFAKDWRAFSVQAPVFSLHSRRSWGAGDVADLDEFARIVARQHTSVISTLPLLATFGPDEFEASPYRPVSRRFWSDRWIALDRVDDLAHSPDAQRLMHETYSPSARSAWVTNGLVDGAAAFSAKRHVLQAWASTQSDAMVHDDDGLRRYVVDHPEVNEYARFRAAGERFGLDWNQWPSTARSGLLRWNDVDPSVVRYHLLAQWIIDEQMTVLSSNLAQRGQTLELDIPVGVHPLGFDVWRDRDQYVRTMSIGAPPDDLSALGQNWASAPLHPERCRDDAHSQFRSALQFHMRVAGIVRIDHVMGLQRLFWVPDGATPEQGLYVSMPFEELLAIVAIEAQRLGVDVVGEDLGTVEADLRAAMEREGLRRTYVAQYAIDTTDNELAAVPAGAVASFATHDTATFWGWWAEADIDERRRLDLMDLAQTSAARERRASERRALRTALACDSDDPADVLMALHERLARGDAGLVMVQLDDLLGEDTAVNLPGTTVERPNWQRLSRLSLEELASSRVLGEALGALSRQRGFASAGADATTSNVRDVSRLSADDVHLLSEGRHFRLYEHLGCHPMVVDGESGCYFAVWAPNAERVSVIGDFNDWDPSRHPLTPRESSGVWEGFIGGVGELTRYKYRLRSRLGGEEFDKADPMGRYFEVPPETATRVWHSTHAWDDDEWIERRNVGVPLAEPMSIYEVHLGSWRRVPEEDNRSLSYRELAPLLIEHVRATGFTHVELLPVMEHPFYGSWGYQTTGYFAPTSRLGTPDDFKFLIDELHRAGIGVILDWVPSHFPSDAFALARFDGTYLYEHADVRQRVHPDWQSWTFNYSRNEVRCFLISNAFYWLDEFHVDGLRVDAVASMLYLDYSRQPGQWVPNQYGGNEDLDAMEFLRQCTHEVTSHFPGVSIIAEESTAWPGVTAPVSDGGLGFTFKWDMGWMHDTLAYLAREAIHRKYHQHDLTFRAVYATNEHFVLPLSHDEVVHGKGSLVAKMSGDDWQRRANLRVLFGYQFTIPGKKLLFMGAEFAQNAEWRHDVSLDWHLWDVAEHRGVARWVRALNDLYCDEPSLHRDDVDNGGFEWVHFDDAQQSVLVWKRTSGDDELMIMANFTPVPRDGYEFRVHSASRWDVVANSDDAEFAGSGYSIERSFTSSDVVDHSGAYALTVTLPPLSLVVLRRVD